MPNVNIAATLKECAIISWKSWWLRWINWRLDRYIKCAKRNKQRYGKIESMIYRYNLTFGEYLLSDTEKEC